jgi:rhodanese-related sulfurtransferase
MASQNVQFRTKSTNPNLPGVTDVEPKELWEQKDRVVLVDVRRPDEFTGELGHIPGAKPMVLDMLPQTIDDLPKDKTVVFICRSGGRSAKATAFAIEQGYTDVYNMKGGMLLWNQLALPTEGKNS